jgi:pyruvate/2-oxoglutarate/acetoin dehydrogenase E1 component
MNMRTISVVEAAREATEAILTESNDYIVIGEGAHDPKACFGTTRGLKEKFPNQVFDMPVSENGMTGVCIGAALGGLKPIMIHMRQDFMLYAMDQIVNNAAKWHSVFGGQKSVPMVIKAFTGRGFGAGHQHAQNLEALFSHIPGLKVVCPSNAYNAKGLFIAACRDPNPVIFLEHRWIHPLLSEVPEGVFEIPLGEAAIPRQGNDVTIVTWGHMTKEAIRAHQLLATADISAEVIDLQTLRPLDMGTILSSVKKTRRLLVAQESWREGGLASEIITAVMETGLHLDHHPMRVSNLNSYPASTPALTRNYYPTFTEITNTAHYMMTGQFFKKFPPQALSYHDVPNLEFKGPF